MTLVYHALLFILKVRVPADAHHHAVAGSRVHTSQAPVDTGLKSSG